MGEALGCFPASDGACRPRRRCKRPRVAGMNGSWHAAAVPCKGCNAPGDEKARHVRGRQQLAASLQAPEAPPEVKEWAQNTVMGVLAGLVLGGGRQWLQDRRYGASDCRGSMLFYYGPCSGRLQWRQCLCCRNMHVMLVTADSCAPPRTAMSCRPFAGLQQRVRRSHTRADACRAAAGHGWCADEAACGEGAGRAPHAGHRPPIQRSHQVAVDR